MAKVNRLVQRFVQATIGEYSNDPLGLIHVARLNYYRGIMLALEVSNDKKYSGKDFEKDLFDFHELVKKGIKEMEIIQVKRIVEQSKTEGLKGTWYQQS